MSKFGSYLHSKQSSEPASLCTPECGYKGLYESAQHSLAALAANHSSALSSRLRIRSAVAAILKKWFSRQALQAEMQTKQKLEKFSDEALLGLLDKLVESAANPFKSSSTEAIDDLRDALKTAGFPVPASADLHMWASAIRQQSSQPTSSSTNFWEDLQRTPAPQPNPPSSATAPPELPQLPAPKTEEPVTLSEEDQPSNTSQDLSDSPEDEVEWSDLFEEDPMGTQEDIDISEMEDFSTDDYLEENLVEDFTLVEDTTPTHFPGQLFGPSVLAVSNTAKRSQKKLKPVISKATAPGAFEGSESSPVEQMDQMLRAPSPLFTEHLASLFDKNTVSVWVDLTKSPPHNTLTVVSGRPTFRPFGQLLVPSQNLRSKPPLLDSAWCSIISKLEGVFLYDAAVWFSHLTKTLGTVPPTCIVEGFSLMCAASTSMGAEMHVLILTSDPILAKETVVSLLQKDSISRLDTLNLSVYSSAYASVKELIDNEPLPFTILCSQLEETFHV